MPEWLLVSLTILAGCFIGLTLGWLNSYCATKPVREALDDGWEVTWGDGWHECKNPKCTRIHPRREDGGSNDE